MSTTPQESQSVDSEQQTLSLLREHAHAVRRWARRRRARVNGGGFGKDLCGMCAIASAELFSRLEKHRVKDLCILVHDTGEYGHCYVGADRYIVDVTAAQFRRRDVAAVDIRPRVEAANVLRAWQPTHKVRSVRQLIELQQDLGWPRRQIPCDAGSESKRGDSDKAMAEAPAWKRHCGSRLVSTSGRCRAKSQHAKQRRRQQSS